jgi:hypothetical protein
MNQAEAKPNIFSPTIKAQVGGNITNQFSSRFRRDNAPMAQVSGEEIPVFGVDSC